MTLPAPFEPLVVGGQGLDRYPAPSDALAQRLACLYGVPVECVLPVRGVTHGLELVFRLAAKTDLKVRYPDEGPSRRLAGLYRTAKATADLGAVILSEPAPSEEVVDQASCIAPALLVVDEGAVEYGDTPSAVGLIERSPNLVVLRSLSLAYGLAGARVGAALGRPESLAELASVLEPYALPESSVRLALQVLDASRLLETSFRVSKTRQEQARVAALLCDRMALRVGSGPALSVRPPDPASVLAALARCGITARADDADIQLPISADPAINNRALFALGVTPSTIRSDRVGQALRDTKETRIACAVNLDLSSPVAVHTGVGFFDHMLEQVAAHAGFSLRLSCDGDLHIDPHHTIEDCAISLGQALKQALGDRRGVARYGFVLPMDDAEARISIDLSGRPYAVFDGDFAAARLGGYPTDLTAHVVRSLAEHLGAAIHVTVTGHDDHHKTEAVYKGLGRALRQAIRVESDAIPSTKGVL